MFNKLKQGERERTMSSIWNYLALFRAVLGVLGFLYYKNSHEGVTEHIFVYRIFPVSKSLKTFILKENGKILLS